MNPRRIVTAILTVSLVSMAVTVHQAAAAVSYWKYMCDTYYRPNVAAEIAVGLQKYSDAQTKRGAAFDISGEAEAAFAANSGQMSAENINLYNAAMDAGNAQISQAESHECDAAVAASAGAAQKTAGDADYDASSYLDACDHYYHEGGTPGALQHYQTATSGWDSAYQCYAQAHYYFTYAKELASP